MWRYGKQTQPDTAQFTSFEEIQFRRKKSLLNLDAKFSGSIYFETHMHDNIFRNSSVVKELENESTIPFSTFTPTRTPLQRLLQPPHLSQSDFSFISLCSALPTPLLHSFISLYLSFRVTSGGQQGVGEELMELFWCGLTLFRPENG